MTRQAPWSFLQKSIEVDTEEKTPAFACTRLTP